MVRKGILFVLSGPSGAGKGTILRSVFEQVDNLFYSISATTRKPRPGEIDGVNYLFVDDNEFTKRLDNDEFLEHVQKYGNRYGTLKRYVDDALRDGSDVVLEIETIGAANIKKIYNDAVLIFITPSNPKEIRYRLSERMTEDEVSREVRLKLGVEEMESILEYNYIAINDDVDICVQQVVSIISAERAKIANNKLLVDNLLDKVKQNKEV